MKYTEKIIESSVLLLVIIDMILLLILTFSNVSQHVEQKIIYFDLFVCFILWIDFIYNLYKSNNKKQFLKENWLTIIAIIPFRLFFLKMVQIHKNNTFNKIQQSITLFKRMGTFSCLFYQINKPG